MARVGDSEIGGHTQSTLLYRVVPELSFKVEIFAALLLFGKERLAGFLDKLILGNESRVEFIKLLSEASRSILPLNEHSQILNNFAQKKSNLYSDRGMNIEHICLSTSHICLYVCYSSLNAK